MDHRFKGVTNGLEVIGEIPMRKSREEFEVIRDMYALAAINQVVPFTLRQELEGWARSYYTLQKHVEAIEAYGTPKLPEPNDDAWNTTKQHTLTLFRRFPIVTPISYKDFDSVRWLQSSAAGYGYVGRKGDDDNYKKAKKTAVTIAEALDHDRSYGAQAIEDSTPDVAFTRTQLSQLKVKSKIRNVWGEAFHYVLLEGLFADPLIEAFIKMDTFYFIGKNPLLSVPKVINELFSAYDYIYMFDWSGFDSSVQEWELRFAFLCLEQMLTFPSNVEAQIWRFLIELFIYRKIASPEGVLYVKTHGIPSGSCFTNIIGSIVNYIRIQYMFKRLTNRFAEVRTHGDDSLAAVNTDQFVPLDKFALICEPLGWKININKSRMSNTHEETSFLSRSVREQQNAREELVCLRMLAYPEYAVPSGDVSALRAWSIATDAGINSTYLYRVYSILKERFGVAQSLPYQLMSWDPTEYEARKISASYLL